MTTIAYRDGVMAADSLVSLGDSRVGDARKLVRRAGAVIGLSGDVPCWHPFCEWYANGADPEKWPKDMSQFSALVATRSGLVEYCGPHPMVIEAPFHAIGNGHPVALGAMHMGADAKTAVRISSKVDLFTGGPIRTLKCPEVR